MTILSMPPAGTLVADRTALLRMLEEQDTLTGFVPDPNATPVQVRQAMQAAGIRPQDNEFSREIIEARKSR